jgi:hypothetical protein
MTIELTKDEILQVWEWAVEEREDAARRGASVKLYRRGLSAVGHCAINIASIWAAHKALDLPYAYQPFNTWRDPDLVWEGRTFDVKSSCYGDTLNVTGNQDHPFDGYLLMHQLSKDPDLSLWEPKGWIPTARFLERAIRKTWRADQKEPSLVVGLGDLESILTTPSALV